MKDNIVAENRAKYKTGTISFLAEYTHAKSTCRTGETYQSRAINNVLFEIELNDGVRTVHVVGSSGVAKGEGRGAKGAAAPNKGLMRNFLCFILFTSTTLLQIVTLLTLR